MNPKYILRIVNGTKHLYKRVGVLYAVVGKLSGKIYTGYTFEDLQITGKYSNCVETVINCNSDDELHLALFIEQL